jgi:hypothetical protein
VDALLKKYEGREEYLMENLKKKYEILSPKKVSINK